jgi:hypothetical protein
MYKIGQKVQITDTTEPIIGYIVKIEIDPLEETDVAFESKEWVGYTIRVYKPFYTNGYTDFSRTENDIKNVGG